MKTTLPELSVGAGVALLALGGAFLLGVTAGRRTRAAAASPGKTTARPVEASPPKRVAEAPADPIIREAPATTGVGSPIGDAPYASGARY